MFTDALAAKAFDKKDIVTNGIMPVAVVIQNDNGFAVEVEGGSIELLVKGDRIRPVSPEEAVIRIFQLRQSKHEVRVTVYKSNTDAYDDFSRKHIGTWKIEPKSLASGFIYVPVKELTNLRVDLLEAQIYIPDLYKADTGQSMMFIEIDLKPAINAGPKK
jgi:hypothetical protein